MQLRQIRDFVAVAQAGSLRAAARALGISQPAMSKSIRQLEEELHVQLLQRSGRGTLITRAGKAVLARARVVQAELKKIDDDLEQLRGERGGSVVIGVAPAASVLIVPEALASFRQRYPSARVRLVEGMSNSLLPMVRDATLDFAVGRKSPAKLDPGIRFKPLHTTRMIVACRRGHPLSGARSVRDLAEASWVTFASTGTGGTLFPMYSAAGLPPPRIAVECESYTIGLAVLASTDALGVLVPQLLEARYAHGFLQQIRIEDPVPSITFGMFSRTDAPLTPAASEMAAAMTTVARRLASTSR